MTYGQREFIEGFYYLYYLLLLFAFVSIPPKYALVKQHHTTVFTLQHGLMLHFK